MVKKKDLNVEKKTETGEKLWTDNKTSKSDQIKSETEERKSKITNKYI